MIKVLSRILKISGEYKSKFYKAFVLSFFESLLTRAPIFVLMYVFFELIEGTLSYNTALISGVVVLVSMLLRTMFRYFVDINQSGVGYKIFARERMSLGDRIKRFPMGYFSEDNIGQLSAVITNDINFIEEYGIDAFSKLTSSILSIIISIAFLAIFNLWLALITVIVCVISYFIFGVIAKISIEESYNMQEIQKDMTGTVIEYVKGMPVVKSFNLAGEKHKATARNFKRMSETQLSYEQRFTAPLIVLQCVTAIGIAAFIIVSGTQGLSGGIEMAYMASLAIFSFDVFVPILTLASITAQVRVMEAAFDRLVSVQKTDIIDKDGKQITLNKFDVEFDNVTFAYEKKDIIKGVSFTVPEKSMTALVGHSGCGKSTIANLVARFYDVQGGSVKVGGVDVKKMTCESLLKNISMVFQDVYLFNDTVLNNIKFGNLNATQEEIELACKKARCHDFIMALENGYDTMIGEGGSSLSGGEKQRISIARAILKDAPIILLDEATASVDPDNEAYIQQAISEMVKGKTLIVIAHKLSSIKNADQILMIKDGVICEKGTHEELLANKNEYCSLWTKRNATKSWQIG